MPRRVKKVTAVYITNNTKYTEFQFHGVTVHLPKGRSLVDDLVLPSGVDKEVTKQFLANFLVRKGITNGQQLITLSHTATVEEVPILRADLSKEELAEIKAQLREEEAAALRKGAKKLVKDEIERAGKIEETQPV